MCRVFQISVSDFYIDIVAVGRQIFLPSLYSPNRRNIQVLFLDTSGLFVILTVEIFAKRRLKLCEKGDNTIFITNMTGWLVNKSNTRQVCNERETARSRVGPESDLTSVGKYKFQFPRVKSRV